MRENLNWQQIKPLDEILGQIYKKGSKDSDIIVKLAATCEAFNSKAWVWKHRCLYVYVLWYLRQGAYGFAGVYLSVC